jgi:3-oxoacyl-[acyl-carrier-protein] synthase II
MSFFVRGIGAVTPLAANIEQTWAELLGGAEATRQVLANGFGGRTYYCARVPQKFTSAVAKESRLRRAGTISLLGVTAGLAALENAGIPRDQARGGAIVFAISCGGVEYTRRFYHEVATEGANLASPLLFPETVYNAPASHLASLLKIDNRDYTLVGDSSVGLSAVHFASQLLATDPELEFCIVVGVEETDWVLADAFATWRLVTTQASFEVFGSMRGTILAESAAAIVLGRSGRIEVARVSGGIPFFRQRDAASALRDVVAQVSRGKSPAGILCSANGTFADRAEEIVLRQTFSSVPVYSHKPAIGDSLGASGVLNIVLAAMTLEQQMLPPTLHSGGRLESVTQEQTKIDGTEVLVSSVGFNQQANAALLALNG